MTPRPAPPRCRCGCGALSPQGNQGGFATRACYQLWLLRQRPPPDDAQITALRREGKSLEAIAREVRLGEAVVRHRLRALGVKAPKKPVSAEHARRVRRQAEAPAEPKQNSSRSSMPWARVGTYVHPPLSAAWHYGCPVCARRMIGPLLAEVPGWRGVRL